MLKSLNTDSKPYIVTMDRGYSSFNIFETCNRLNNCFYVIRTKAGKLMVRLQENDILPYQPGVGAWYGDGKTLSIRTKAGELMVRRKEIDTLPYHGPPAE